MHGIQLPFVPHALMVAAVPLLLQLPMLPTAAGQLPQLAHARLALKAADPFAGGLLLSPAQPFARFLHATRPLQKKDLYMAGELKVDATWLQVWRPVRLAWSRPAEEYITHEEPFEHINAVLNNIDDTARVRTVLRF